MNGIHEVTGSIPAWSTTFPDPRKMPARKLGGSTAEIPPPAKTFVSNEIHFRPNRDRTAALEKFWWRRLSQGTDSGLRS